MSVIAHKSRTDAIFSTQLGWIGIVGSVRGVRFLTFGHTGRRQVQDALRPARSTIQSDPDVKSPSTDEALEWPSTAQMLLERYAAGEPVDLGVLPVELPGMTRFQQRVVDALQRVGYGETISYLELAERAGSPGAARAVGNIMARNTIPLLIPCHRVIGSGGRLGGFSAPQGLTMKRRLLELEQAGRAWDR